MIIGTAGAIAAGKNTLGDHLVMTRQAVLMNTSDAIVEEVKTQLKATMDVYAGLKYKMQPGTFVPPETHHRILVTERDDFGRRILQDHGVSRRRVNPDYWIPIWTRAIMHQVNLRRDVVIPGIRYQNEIEMIRRLGVKIGIFAWVVKVERSNQVVTEAMAHEVEHGLDNYADWDHVFVNDGDVPKL